MEDGLDFDYIFKYILVGNASVGKSALLQMFVNKKFNMDTNPTMGVEFATQKMKVKDKIIKLQIWDTVTFHLFRLDNSHLGPLREPIIEMQLELY